MLLDKPDNFNVLVLENYFFSISKAVNRNIDLELKLSLEHFSQTKMHLIVNFRIWLLLNNA